MEKAGSSGLDAARLHRRERGVLHPSRSPQSFFAKMKGARVERIRTEADLAAGAALLLAIDARFAPLLAAAGPLPLRHRAPGFGAFFSAIVSQQVSTASAAAIWARLEAAGLTDAAAVSRAGDDALRGCGLSRPKAAYACALAMAGVDFAGLEQAGTAEVVATLTAIPGIGRWTAEVYATFSLGHADVFAAGDLALQEAARIAFDLPVRPPERALRAIAADWAPVRAIAARTLWAYYRVAKNREGIR